MAADVTVYDAVLKDTYGGIPTDELNQATPLWTKIKRTTRPMEGRQWIVALHNRRNQQIGAQALAGATIPTVSTQASEGFDDAKYKPTQLLGVIQIEHSLMELARSNEGSFIRALRSEVENMATNFAVDFDRQLFGDQTGALTICGVTTASTSVVVASTGLLDVGMGIDVLVASTGAVSTGAAGRTVSSITSATVFVISGAAITTDATFSVYRAASKLLTANNEINGLQNIVKATGALGGLDPATAGLEVWKAALVDTTSTTAAEKVFQKAYEAPQEQQRGGGGRPKLLIGTFGTRRSYMDGLVALKRFSQDQMRMVGGFEALDFNGLPFYSDRFCTTKYVYFLDTDRLFFLQTRDAHWVDDDKAVLKWVSNTVGFKGIYAWIVQFATDARNAHSVLQAINES